MLNVHLAECTMQLRILAFAPCRKVLFKFTWRGPIMEMFSSSTGKAHAFDYSHVFGAK